ncbi:MAG: hypothetical protein EAZ42_04925 [Verrucomicrobia bacterium]|nr:MAG: hypothetical protein EAZ42_04925 [Verrucomicrobiota bacterium]
MIAIDINADLGEGASHDAAIMPLINSCNIACGGHAGDGDLMNLTVKIAMQQGVHIGAHPGYADRENFGRLPHNLSEIEVVALVEQQVQNLLECIDRHSASLHHLKLHGALYHRANEDAACAAALAAWCEKMLPQTIIFVPPMGAFFAALSQCGHPLWREGFVDRRYGDNGMLLPRSHPQALIHDPQEAARHAHQLARTGHFDTLCVHGDGEQAFNILTTLRSDFIF